MPLKHGSGGGGKAFKERNCRECAELLRASRISLEERARCAHVEGNEPLERSNLRIRRRLDTAEGESEREIEREHKKLSLFFVF